MIAFNKEDLGDRDEVNAVCRRYGAVSMSALKPETFNRLLEAIEERIWPLK
jgi:50S ribosomal subunit-associated GTPase HflX